MSVKPDRPCCEAEYYELVGQYNKLAALEVLERGTPECDEFLRLRDIINAPQPAYFPCEYCGKEDHTGWSTDPRVSTLEYTKYCSEECSANSSKEYKDWLEEIKNRSVEDFPKTLDVQTYTELSIWAANIALQDPELRQSLEEAHPLYRFPEFLAKVGRERSLDNISSEYEEFPSRGTFVFKKPLPRKLAIESFGMTEGEE